MKDSSSLPHEELPVVDEKIWNAWILKSNLRELRRAQRMKICFGIALSLLVIGFGLHLAWK